MKILCLLFSVLISFSIWAEKLDYQVTQKGNKFYLEAKKLSWEFVYQAAKPKITKVEALDKSHDLVIYLAEEAGTKYTIVMYKAVIVDNIKRKILTKEPLDYLFIKKASGEVEAKASFKLQDGKILWSFEEDKIVIDI